MTSEEMISISEVHLESDPNRGNMVVLKENAEAGRKAWWSRNVL
jgi:hypothetical protein